MVAPILKQQYAVSVDALTFRVTDKTGSYSTANPGGWGGANLAQGVGPNWDLKNCAVFAVVKLQASDGDQYFVASVNDITTNPSAGNGDETTIEFTNLNDGVLEVTMGILKVSTDGVNYLQDALAIPNNDFFYWNHNGSYVWKMVGGVPTAVADIHTLVDESSVNKVTATDIIEGRLAIIKQKLYKQYRLNRDTDCEDADVLFQELLKLSQDIQGSIYAFYSGLTTEAQSQVETMLDRYSLTNVVQA